jgi:hypothetical protein
VRYRIVEQATVDRVVRTDGLSAGLVDGFVAAAHKPAAAGVAGLGIPDARVRHPDPAGVVASQPAPAGVFVDARALRLRTGWRQIMWRPETVREAPS